GEAEEVRRRHAEFFRTLVEEAEPRIWWEEAVWYRRLDAEYPNLRVALSWFAEQGDADSHAAELGLRLFAGLFPWYLRVGLVEEAQRWGNRLLMRATATARTAARALGEAVAIRRTLPNLAQRAASLMNLGLVAEARGDRARRIALLEESVVLLRKAGAWRLLPDALLALGRLAHECGEVSRAEA